jgi:D-alanine-D-alanine ligase-like ATP-grasp enzyme
MKKEQPRPLLGLLLEKLAPRIGARVVMEPEWNIVGQIIFKKGKKRYFRYSALDINSMGSAQLAKDKDYANYFMKRMGYPVVEGKTFYSDDWAHKIHSNRTIDAAYKYAHKISRGFSKPVIVKPNNGQQGRGVALAHTKPEFYRALKTIFKNDPVALVQEYVKGRDYRIVVLDDEVFAAYERIPLSVIGDGRSAIAQLLSKKQKEFKGSSRDIHIEPADPRIREKLKRQGFTLNSIPAKNAQVFLLDNANMSSGGEAVDVTRKIHSDFKKIAVQLTKDMGLRLCGVDLMVEGDVTKKSSQYHVLEINAAPGLDHYSKVGNTQRKAVESLYLKALKLMEKEA